MKTPHGGHNGLVTRAPSDGMSETLPVRVEETVRARLAEDADWTIDDGAGGDLTVTLPDRELVVHRRAGPDGADRWTLELAADGATVSKFGPFESVGTVTDRVGALLDCEVRYTVCCDG